MLILKFIKEINFKIEINFIFEDYQMAFAVWSCLNIVNYFIF